MCVLVKDKWFGIRIQENRTNCWQFLADYYREEFGIHIENYKGRVKKHEGRRKLAEFLNIHLFDNDDWQKVDNPKYPDIVMFKIKGLAIHGGIVLGDNKMLHMTAIHGSTIGEYDNNGIAGLAKKNSLYGFYRHKDFKEM